MGLTAFRHGVWRYREFLVSGYGVGEPLVPFLLKFQQRSVILARQKTVCCRSVFGMSSVKKKRRAKMAKHKRKKRSRMNRHKT
jgi:hypothetical protein